MLTSGYLKLLCKPSKVFKTGCDILVIFVSTYLMSRCFLMIPQTRQFPTRFATTSMECTVAMAMPDDWSMTECCRCYTVPRPFRFPENIKNESVNGKRKQKCQSQNVRDIRCPMNISSFNVSYVQIKVEEISYLHYITPCDLFWFEYTTLPLCQLQGRTCCKMHAGVFWGNANHRHHLSYNDWVDLPPSGIISLLIPMTLFSSQAQNKMTLAWSKCAP